MKQLVCVEPGNFEINEVAEPDLVEGSVKIKINYIGICGTDIHAFKGEQAFFSYPRVLGHELSGEVVEAESTLKHLIGKNVVIIPGISCGKCIACRRGKENCCEAIQVTGVHKDGGMTPYLIVPSKNVIVIDQLSMEMAAIVEPLAIGAHGIYRAGKISNRNIAVVGAGPIGVGLALQCRIEGARTIILDVDENRLRYCRDKFGFEDCLNVGEEEGIDHLKEITNGEFCEVVFDATGNKRALENGIRYMAHGGSYVLVGLSNDDLTFNHPSIHKKESSILCSRNATSKDFLKVINQLETGKLNIDNYVNYKSGLSELPNTMDFISNPKNKVLKAVMKMDFS